MSEQPDPTQDEAVTITEGAWLESQRLGVAAHERIEKHRIDANKEVALAQSSESRRLMSLNCALASFGVGHQSLNPPAVKPGTDEVLARATTFDAFLRGQPAHSAVVVTLSPAGGCGSETPPAA